MFKNRNKRNVRIFLSFYFILVGAIFVLALRNYLVYADSRKEQKITQVVTPSPSVSEATPTAQPTPTQTLSAQPRAIENTQRTVETIEDVRGLGYIDSRKIVYDKNGTIYATFRKKDQSLPGKEYMIYVSRSMDSGNTWQLVNNGRSLSGGVGAYDQRVPSIAIDGSGGLHVAWYGVDSERNGKNQREIKYARSLDGGNSWTNWKNIVPIDGYAGQDYWQEHPSITTYGKMVYIVWEGKDNNNPKKQQVMFIRSDDQGETWSKPAIVYRIANHTQSRPALIRRKNGELIIAIYSSYKMKNSIQQIQISTSGDNGNSWSEWRNVSNTNQDARHVSLVESDDGTVYFAWRQIIGEAKTQIYTSSLKNGSITAAQPINTKTNNQYFPSLTIVDNNLVIGWMESNQAKDLPSEEVNLPATTYIYKRSLTSSSWQEVNKFTGGYPSLPLRGNSDQVTGLYLSGSDKKYKIIYFQQLL